MLFPMLVFHCEWRHSYWQVCTTIRPIGDNSNRTPASWSSNFANNSYVYRPNWTPLGPITIINQIAGTGEGSHKCLSQHNTSIYRSLRLTMSSTIET